MTSLEFTRTTVPSLAGSLLAAVGAVALRVSRIARAIKHRRDVATLAGFDDRMLSDIGLTRSDLRDAVSEPLWRDPTRILVSRVRERRENRTVPQREQDLRLFGAPSIVPSRVPSASQLTIAH